MEDIVNFKNAKNSQKVRIRAHNLENFVKALIFSRKFPAKTPFKKKILHIQPYFVTYAIGIRRLLTTICEVFILCLDKTFILKKFLIKFVATSLQTGLRVDSVAKLKSLQVIFRPCWILSPYGSSVFSWLRIKNVELFRK